MQPNNPLQIMRDKYARAPVAPGVSRRMSKSKYAEYLSTDDWKKKARLVHIRAGHICEGCRINPSEEVHHLTYRHVRKEFLFELVALCGPCHDRWHVK